MLKQFSSFMKTRFRETDVLGRIGGDKFGVLLESCIPWQAREVVETLYRELRSFHFECGGTTIPVSLSTGMTGINAKMTEPERALGAAEAACYLAKQRGGDAFYEYEAQDVMNSPRHSQAEILHEIQVALRNDGFQLYAQQIAPLQAPEGDPAMFEILLRMHSRDGTLVLPNLFIPVAERHRIMTAIDRWVFTHALEVISERTRSAADHQTLYTINISGQSLGDDGFLEFMLNQLSYRGVEPGRVCVEITETATVANFEAAQRFVAVLKGRGCRFVLDDFGSGLSSFAYLRRFPLDFIKIDGQFVKGMTKDPTHQALVESINHVGHVMQIKTIAESVEDAQTAEVLRNMRVDYAQGHHFSFPEPVEIALSNDPSSGRHSARNAEIA